MPASSWFILGAGSIGCLFAAYLRRAGHPVTLILRDRALVEQLRERGGLRLYSALKATDAASPSALGTVEVRAATLSQLQETPQRVLVCTKAHQTLAALRAAAPALAPQAQLVLLQNGMGVREQVRTLLPNATIAHAITTEGAWRRDRFDVVHAGRGETLVGVPDSPPAQARAIAAALACELTIRADDAIVSRLWLKLAVNCVINPLTALRECRNGELLQQADIRAQVATLCAELSRVARGAGQSLPQALLEHSVFDVMRRTAANQSSMWQDLQQRRLTEIDFINGYVVREAARLGLPCPAHAALLDAVKRKEAQLGCT